MNQKLNKVLTVIGRQPIVDINNKYYSEINCFLQANGITPSKKVFDILMLGYAIGRKEL